MKYKDFSKQQWDLIRDSLKSWVDSNPGPHYAAFDADGTLWDMDMGESFFDFQIKNCNLPDMPRDPWAHYVHLKSIDRNVAYLWLAQINKGIMLDQVRTWSRQNVDLLKSVPIFEPQLRLIEYLKTLGIKVFVVTASITWAVEPAALKFYEIPYEQVLGVETVVENGQVTEAQNGVVTWNEGKAKKILEMTGGIAPLLASGNTMGDLELLNIARLLRFAVGATVPGDRLYKTECELTEIALLNGWQTHRFV
jgi:phosphoserine phosphatase